MVSISSGMIDPSEQTGLMLKGQNRCAIGKLCRGEGSSALIIDTAGDQLVGIVG